MATAKTAIKVVGEPIVAGLPKNINLTIPGVSEINSETVSEGYKQSQDVEDKDGNVASVILSHYGITVQFTGLLSDTTGATVPTVGDEVKLTVNGIDFPTAHISDISMAYTISGQATVSGTVTGYAKLPAAAEA